MNDCRAKNEDYVCAVYPEEEIGEIAFLNNATNDDVNDEDYDTDQSENEENHVCPFWEEEQFDGVVKHHINVDDVKDDFVAPMALNLSDPVFHSLLLS